MSKPRLTYFDSPASRGEECRLAFAIAGVDFEDNRLQRAQWADLKPRTPFGSLPTLEMPGQPVLAQSNAILTFIGRRHGLLPKDDLEAARHQAMMEHVEDLRHALNPSLRIEDPVEKKKAREALASGYIPAWAERAERQIGDGPFFGGKQPSVADVKLYVVVRWLSGGVIDHIPTTILAQYPKLNRVHDSVRDHAAVKAWYAKS